MIIIVENSVNKHLKDVDCFINSCQVIYQEILNDHQFQADGFKARRAKTPTERESVLKTVVLNHRSSAKGGLKPLWKINL